MKTKIVHNLKNKLTRKQTNIKSKTYIKEIKIRDIPTIKYDFTIKYNYKDLYLNIQNDKDIKLNLNNTEINKINKINKYTRTDLVSLDYLILLNPYEILTYYLINRNYYINNILYHSDKINTDIYTINDNVIVPMYKKYDINLYEKPLFIYEMLKENNILHNNIKNILSLDLFGPIEVNNKTLYLKSDLQEVLSLFLDIKKKYNLITIYDYYDWGKNIKYDNIVINNFDKELIYLIKKIKSVKDIQQIEKYILKHTNNKKLDLIYIRNQNYYNNTDCEFQYFSVKYLINYMLLILPIINKNATLIININSFPYIDILLQVVFIISSYFDKMTFYSSKLGYYDNYIIFKNYKYDNAPDLSLLLKIRKIVLNNIDTDLNYNIRDKNINCIVSSSKPPKNKYINNLILKDTNYNDFKTRFITNILHLYIDKFNNIDKLFNYLKTIQTTNSKLYDDTVKYILLNNINICYNYCKTNNIKVNNYYLDTENNYNNQLLQNNKYIRYYFPNEKNVDYTKLQISRIGLYSISKEYIHNFLEHKLKQLIINYKDLIICDANGGIGGDTLLFTKMFKFVNVVELEPLHCKIIENNCKVFNRINFKVYNANILDFVNDFKNLEINDILYFDPPWGGIGYKSNEKIELYYDNTKFSDFINSILNRFNNKKIIMKLPYNYNLKKINSTYKMFKIGNVLFIFLNI